MHGTIDYVDEDVIMVTVYDPVTKITESTVYSHERHQQVTQGSLF